MIKMDSGTMAMRAPSSLYFARLKKTDPNFSSSFLRIHKKKERNSNHKSLKFTQYHTNPNFNSSSLFCLKSDAQNPSSSISCSAMMETSVDCSELATCKLQCLVSEFESLSEPIDRVKRLLHYATRLPRFDESKRVPSNKVTGCTAQVWLDADMDEYGRMRFSVDSDSEIVKGFCSCLIWILDGALPEEVLKLKTEDLVALNVGLSGRAHSRVNTWHNVLISMQKRTEALVADREKKKQQRMDSFPFSGYCIR